MSKIIAAGVFIVRKDGKLLVCHPTNHDKDFFSIPKGKVERGETFVGAAFRETYEETNLNLRGDNNFECYGLEPVTYSHKKKVLKPFICVEKEDSNFDWNGSEIKCNSNVPEDRGGFPEMDGYKWVTIEEARKILHATQVACLTKLNELIKL